MRKRKLDGKTYYVFTDEDYEAVVGVHINFDDEDNEENRHLCCHGCVDRFKEDKICPTPKALGIKIDKDRGCRIRVCDEDGLVDYMAKRMGA